jgi:hypothetical protein
VESIQRGSWGYPPGDPQEGTTSRGPPPGGNIQGTPYQGNPHWDSLQGTPSSGHSPRNPLQRTSYRGSPPWDHFHGTPPVYAFMETLPRGPLLVIHYKAITSRGLLAGDPSRETRQANSQHVNVSRGFPPLYRVQGISSRGPTSVNSPGDPHFGPTREDPTRGKHQGSNQVTPRKTHPEENLKGTPTRRTSKGNPTMLHTKTTTHKGSPGGRPRWDHQSDFPRGTLPEDPR